MPETLFPVCIVTKGRPHGKTMQVLTASAVGFTVVVEPQDASSYRDAGWTTQHILSANNQDLPYARRAALAAHPASWFWMLDDDISAFYETVRGKTSPTTARHALEQAQRYFSTRDTVAQAGLEYQQFAWGAKQPYIRTGYCDVCVAIHGGRTSLLTYRDNMCLKEDRDFTLQVLASGYDTLRVTRYSFACPKNGSNPGGLQPVYALPGREAAVSRAMAQAWPGICTPQVKEGGRHDVKIDWAFFRRARQNAPRKQ